MSCPACAAMATPAPRHDFPYMLAMSDIQEHGLQAVIDRLCKSHRELYDHARTVTQPARKRKPS